MKKYLVCFLLLMLIATPVAAKNRTVIRRQQELQKQAQPQKPPKKPGDTPGYGGTPGYGSPPGYGIDPGYGNTPGTSRSGYFIAPVAKFTQVNDNFGFMVGGRAGWMLNGRYHIGLGGYALTHQVEANQLASGDTPDMKMMYGGLELEYALLPENLVHFSLYTLIGLGAAEFDYADIDGDDDFFVVEPAVNMWLNLTESLKAGLGVGYRIASGVDLEGLEDSDLSGITATLSLKYTIF